ncbi:hypothetical protein MMC12_005540 [Toensbergia leucococca]|nr:hypothetical protein [Toensbergia leucococca]
MADPASLALSAISAAISIGKAVRGFCKDYQSTPEELELLVQQAKTGEEIINAAYSLLQRLHKLSDTDASTSNSRDIIFEQLALCRKYLYQLSDELKMSSEAAKVHSWARVKKAFKKKELQKPMAKLRDCCDQLCTATSIDSMEQHNKGIWDLQSSLTDLQSHVDELQAYVKKQDIFQWIINETQLEAHRDHAKSFQKGTLDAVLNSDQYYEWQNGLLNDDGTTTVPATLWCHGPPGACKSTLVYAIIERLREFYGKEASIIYTYCSYEKQEVQSTRNILACMVRTAVSEYEPLPECVLEAWKRHDSGSIPLSLSSLRYLLCKLLAGRRKSFILVDALDEITYPGPKSNERQMQPDRVMNEVTSILKNVNKVKADHGQISCRALVTSRERCPDRFLRVEVAEMPFQAAEADVKIRVEAAINEGFFQYLDNKIQKDAKVRVDIVDEVSKDTKGVFLLAELRLEHLRRLRNMREFKDTLNDLP